MSQRILGHIIEQITFGSCGDNSQFHWTPLLPCLEHAEHLSVIEYCGENARSTL